MRRALVCLLMVAVPVGAAVAPAGTAGAAPAYTGPCHAAVDRYFPANVRAAYAMYRKAGLRPWRV